MENLYKILNLDNNTTKDEIKKAYRKLAQKHHPDKGGSEEEFEPIQQAYDILRDDKKRKEYDKTGTINEGPSIISQAENVILGSFQAIINQGEAPFDIIGQVNKALKENINQMDSDEKRANDDLYKVSKLRGRIKSKDNNLFEGLLDQREEGINRALKAMESKKKIIELAIEMIEEYSDAMSSHWEERQKEGQLQLNRLMSSGNIFGEFTK